MRNLSGVAAGAWLAPALLLVIEACAAPGSDGAAEDGSAPGVSPTSDGSPATSGSSGGGSSSGTGGAGSGSSSGAGSTSSSSGGASSGSTSSSGGIADAGSGRDTGSIRDAAAEALGSGGAGDDAAQGSALAGWRLTWSDEFDGADGSPVDPSKWVHDVGGSGWGNQELEYYTNGTQNAVISGGNLVITATPSGASSFQCWNGACQFTSARIKTQGHFSQAYGRFEARIQLPAGQGLWPAFWTLGDNGARWPVCGEIDIMEAVGAEPLINHGSMHGPVSASSSTSYNLTGSAPATASALSTSFHTYAIEWDPGKVTFLLDDVPYETQTTATLSALGASDVWEFDHPFYILLNVAVGGTFPGSPNATTTFPQTMKVDWVRVYERAD